MVDDRSRIATEERRVGQLVGDASEQLSRLVRDEIRLAAAEMRDKGKRGGIGSGLLGTAGVLAFYGGGVLLACVVLALAEVIAPWLAALIVGIVVLLIAAVVALLGRKQWQAATPPVPEHTVANVKSDIDAVKEGARR